MSTSVAPERQRTRSGTQEARRRKILHAATTLFSQRGYVATTMDEIAAAANVTKRTLYRYVGDKEQLLFDIHDQFTARQLVDEMETEAGTPRERFRSLVAAHIQIVVDHRLEILVFFEERKHLGDARRREVERRRNEYEAYCASLVAALRGRPGAPESTDRVLAQAVLGTLTEMYRWYNPKGGVSQKELAEIVSDFFLKGLLSGRRRASRRSRSKAELETLGDGPHDRIRAAAAELFSTLGYHAASMQEIAEAADVTKGALFYYVGTKEELLLDIISDVLRAGIRQFEAANAAGGTNEQILARFIDYFFAFLAVHHNPFAVLNESVKYLPSKSRTEVHALQREWAQSLHDVIGHGIEAGEFNFPNVAIARSLVAGLLNATHRWFSPDGLMASSELAAIYSGLVFSGIASSTVA